LKLAKYMAALPAPSPAFENLTAVYTNTGILDPKVLFPMDGNDRLGDCTCAGIAHGVTVYNGIKGKLVIPSEKDVISLYNKLTCHRDVGYNELDLLTKWRKKSYLGEKIIAFGELDPKNLMHIQQAIQFFGGVYLGFQVQQNCMPDFNNGIPWTPGTLLNEGHAIFATGYDAQYFNILTWGTIQKGTIPWWMETVDEAYAIVPPELATTELLAELQAIIK
jgi:hypothetical protein